MGMFAEDTKISYKREQAYDTWTGDRSSTDVAAEDQETLNEDMGERPTCSGPKTIDIPAGTDGRRNTTKPGFLKKCDN